MISGLASGLAIGSFAIVVQILALCAVNRRSPGESALGCILGFMLGGCMMVGVVMFDPSVFSYKHIEPMAKVATCH